MSLLARLRAPGVSLLPAVAVVLVGLLLHAVDQTIAFRAGPVPILLTAPVVATLVFHYRRAVTARVAAGLLAWGVLASGLAVLGVYVLTVGVQLPRQLTGAEMVAYDLALFCWIVGTLAGVYALAARVGGWRRLGVLLAAPVAGAAFGVVSLVVLELLLA